MSEKVSSRWVLIGLIVLVLLGGLGAAGYGLYRLGVKAGAQSETSPRYDAEWADALIAARRSNRDRYLLDGGGRRGPGRMGEYGLGWEVGMGDRHSPMGRGVGPMAEYWDEMYAAVAKALGLSVEEFEDALAEGRTPQQIAEEQGITQEEFCADLHDAAEEILAQAVSDEVITQEQVDWMLERMNDHCLEGGGPTGCGWGHAPPAE